MTEPPVDGVPWARAGLANPMQMLTIAAIATVSNK
jgi:hypothetical protein